MITISQGADATFSSVDGDFDWEALSPWSARNTTTHRVMRCLLEYTSFTAVAQTDTRTVYLPPGDKVLIVRDAWLFTEIHWTGIETTISVGLGTDDDALLKSVAVTSASYNIQGDTNANKGELLATPHTAWVESSYKSAGITVKLDAGVGKGCNTFTQGSTWLYLDVVEVDFPAFSYV